MPNIGTESNIGLIRFNEQPGTPDTPAAGFSAIYAKSDGLYVIDDDGAVTGPFIASQAGVLLADGSVPLAGAWDMGSQALTNVNIDSGVITGITDLLVADGGTGRSSHTAYAVLCGGTASGAAQQSIAGVGTSGQVLTSNGATALPTMQDATGGGGLGALLPQGRLSLTSGNSNDESDVTGATIYYTPHLGDEITLLSAILEWETITFVETSLSLAGHTANTLYDIWGYNNSGTLDLESTSWGTQTAYNITAMTAAGPCVITYTNGSQIFAVGDNICAQGITGNINTVTHVVTSVTAIGGGAPNFTATIEINTTGLTYTSGGTVRLLDATRATAINIATFDIPVKGGDSERRYLGTILIGGDGAETSMTESRQFVANYYNRVHRKIGSNLDAASTFIFAGGSVYQLPGTPNECNDGQGRISYVAPFGGTDLHAIWASGSFASASGGSQIMAIEQNNIQDFNRPPAADPAFSQASIYTAGFASLFVNSEQEGFNFIQQMVYGTSGFNFTYWVGDTIASSKLRFGLRGYINL